MRSKTNSSGISLLFWTSWLLINIQNYLLGINCVLNPKYEVRNKLIRNCMYMNRCQNSYNIWRNCRTISTSLSLAAINMIAWGFYGIPDASTPCKNVKIFRTNKYEAYNTYLFIFILIKENVLNNNHRRPDNFLIVDCLSQALTLSKHLLGSYACSSSPFQLFF